MGRIYFMRKRKIYSQKDPKNRFLTSFSMTTSRWAAELGKYKSNTLTFS